MADYLPLKIQAKIMKRLPVISLIRFRTVSKQWKSVIDSPKFIADHCVIQDHSQSHHHRHLLLSCNESGVSFWGPVVRFFSIVDDDTFPHQKVVMTTPVSVNRFNLRTSLVGVSGGLLCTSIYGISGHIKNVVLWNPSIKKTVTIVVPNVPDNADYDDLWYYKHKTIVGFGVCPRTSDPKLVKIRSSYMYEKEYATIPYQVEVFSLSSGLWKPPRSKLPRKSIQYSYPQVAINEFIYWLAYDMCSPDWKDQYCRLIMSFDLTSEEFTEVYLPQNLKSLKTHVYISKLNESLVVLEKNNASNANVWIMQDGDPKSFTHIFTISTPITSISDVVGFRKNGEPIIVKKKGSKENELIVYEPNSKQISYTGIVGAFYYFHATTPYTQTLLLLDHKDSEDSETATGIGKGTLSGHFRRVGRTLKGVSRSSLATSSSLSYYGASKRYSQEEVNEVVRKKCKIVGKRISASFNKKLVNLMTQLAEKGINLDKNPVVGEEDEEYEESDDEVEMEDEEYEESDDEEMEDEEYEMVDVDDGMLNEERNDW